MIRVWLSQLERYVDEASAIVDAVEHFSARLEAAPAPAPAPAPAQRAPRRSRAAGGRVLIVEEVPPEAIDATPSKR